MWAYDDVKKRLVNGEMSITQDGDYFVLYVGEREVPIYSKSIWALLGGVFEVYDSTHWTRHRLEVWRKSVVDEDPTKRRTQYEQLEKAIHYGELNETLLNEAIKDLHHFSKITVGEEQLEVQRILRLAVRVRRRIVTDRAEQMRAKLGLS